MDFFTALKQNINEYIVANGNKEITADILRPILLEICNITFAKMGDLELLQTVYKDDLVGAINEALNAESGVKIHYGTFPDPNDATISNFELGDFYAQQGDTGIDSFWQYNGQSWVKIADADSQSGVQSVTGDGVDNTDPENPVLTFPTPAEIGAIEDAPSDGKVYGRKNETWEEVDEFQGVETSNTHDIELSGNGTEADPLEAELTNTVKNDIQKGVTAHGWGNHANAGYEKESNKATDLSNPDNTKYPTTKAVTDAIGAIETTVHTSNTSDIELSGDGTQGNPLEGILTQDVKDDIDKGVDAYNWGDWKDGDLDDMKNESADPFARVSEIGDSNPTLDDVAKNGNVTEESVEVGGLTVVDNYNTTSSRAWYKRVFGKVLYLSSSPSENFVLLKTDFESSESAPLSLNITGGGYTESGGIQANIAFRWVAGSGVSHTHYYKVTTDNVLLNNFKVFEMDGYVHIFFKYLNDGGPTLIYSSLCLDSMNFEITNFSYVNYDTHPDWINVSDLRVRYVAMEHWVESRFVRYDEPQSLTPAEQQQARANLGIEKPKTIIKDSNFLIDNSLSGALVIHEDNIITINKSGLDGMNDGYQVWLRNDSNSDATLAIVNTGDFTFRINDENDKTSSENVTIPKGTIYRIDKKDNNKILIYIFPISNSGGDLELGWSAGQAAEGNQVVRLSTNQTISGVKTFESIPVLPNSNPTSNNQSARKKYVDDQVGSRELLSNKVQDIMSNISPDLYPSTQAVALFAEYILNEFDTEISNYFSTKYRTSNFTLTEDYRLNTIIAGNIEIEIDPNEEVHTSFKCDIVSDHSSGTAISLKSKSGWTYRVNDMDDISSATFRIPAGGKISIYKKTDNQKFIITGNADMQS